MNELGDLYQDLILDHARAPRNAGVIEQPTCLAHGDNPLCGDKIAVTVRMKDGVLEDVRFRGAGCAISTASASLMTEAVKGRPKGEVDRLFDKFHGMVTGGTVADDLGKLEAFRNISEFPVRVKCASLAWHTLKAALEGKQDPVSTE